MFGALQEVAKPLIVLAVQVHDRKINKNWVKAKVMVFSGPWKRYIVDDVRNRQAEPFIEHMWYMAMYMTGIKKMMDPIRRCFIDFISLPSQKRSLRSSSRSGGISVSAGLAP